MSNNDREIMKQILDYDAQMNEVETLVSELQHFKNNRMIYRNDVYLNNKQVKLILDALKQVYGVG